MQFKIFNPVKPLGINQGWGSNPDYYAKFGLKAHNGYDLAASHGQPVYAPCDGLASYKVDDHGGDGIWIKTNDAFDYKTTQVKFIVLLWHLCSKDDPQFRPLIPCDGGWYPIKAGELIGFADNTGAPYESSGDHLHFGLYPQDAQGNKLEPNNGFDGAVDPTPYFNGYFAQDIPAISQAATITSEIANEIPQVDATLQQKLEWYDVLYNIWSKFF